MDAGFASARSRASEEGLLSSDMYDVLAVTGHVQFVAAWA
jgi:hypothetical protein